ncbi:MAG: CehA/McbA family metallohydrolase [Methanobacteriota archaeon]|nr:MAG: CehA/McbA family metallohydrolase [Euryarchaeota archaeon]
MKLDLHIHSRFSRDGTASPEEILRRCKDVGLDGCSITDHNSIEGSLEACEIGAAMGLTVVRGIEISSINGHILAYGLSAPVQRGLSVSETIRRIHAAGGIAVAAHPTRFGSGLGEADIADVGFDAVEILNGGSSGRGNRRASTIAADLKLPGIGGSDAHKIAEIGRSFTVIDEFTSEADVIRSVVEGRPEASGRSRSAGEGLMHAIEATFDWTRRGFKRL